MSGRWVRVLPEDQQPVTDQQSVEVEAALRSEAERHIANGMNSMMISPTSALALAQRIETLEAWGRQIHDALAQRDRLADLLRRLRAWDVLNLPPGRGDDGPYWRREIDAALSEIEQAASNDDGEKEAR